MAAVKDCHACTNYYIKKWEARYGHKPEVNMFAARWGFDSILMGMSVPVVKELIDYYFTTTPQRRYDLDWFFWNYEKLAKSKAEGHSDTEHKQRLLQESKSRAEQWRQSGKQGIADNQRGSTE